MTITKELIKTEVDKVRDEYLGVLYRIVKALEEPGGKPTISEPAGLDPESRWKEFVSQTYGSFSGDPLDRGEQGRYETRVPFE